MDEVELMRGFRTDIPTEDPAARARARARLETKMAEEEAPPTRQSASKRPSRRVLVGAGVATIVVVVFALQAILPPRAGGPSEAQATLSALAAVASQSDSHTLASGQYFYVRTTSVLSRTQTDISGGTSWTFTLDVRREKWLGFDGSGRILERFGQPRFDTAADRAAWQAAGSPPLLPHGDRYDSRFGPGELAPRDLGALPLDAETLARLIDLGRGTGSSGELGGYPLDTVTDLLGEVPASSQLRSALFDATAHVPGIVTQGGARDPDGRLGVAVSLTRSGTRAELIFDPQDSALLARIVVRLDDEGHPIRVLERSVYRQRAVVDTIDARP